MPTVPVNTSVQQAPISGVKQTTVASPELMGGAVAQQQTQFGRAVQQAGATLGGIALQEQQERNLAMVARAETQLGQAQLQFEQQVKDRQGWQADGLDKEATAWWDKAASEHIDMLENDAQKRAMQAVIERKRLASLQRVGDHQRSQLERATTETLNASIGNAIQEAAANAYDAETVSGAIAEIDRKAGAIAALRGWGPEQREAYLTQQRTAAHKKVIEARLLADPASARMYYEQNKAQIAGGDRAAIEKQLEVGTLRHESQQATDGILAMGLSRTDAKKYAREHYTDELRDEVVRRVESRYDQNEAALKEDQIAASDTAYRILAQGGSYDDIPPDVLNRMDGKTQLAFKTGTKAPEGSPRYWQLREMAELRPVEFAQHNLYSDFASIAASEQQELAKLWYTARRGPDPDEVALGRTKWQIIQQGAAQAGLDPKAAEKDNPAGERVRGFYQRVDDEVMAWQRANGKKPGPKEYADIVNRLAIQVTEEQSFLGLDYLNPDEVTAAGQLDIPGIPADIIDELAYGVSQAGQPVTVDNIKKLYGHRYGGAR